MNKNIILSFAFCCCAAGVFAQQRLTLEQCLDNARKHNHDLHLAEQEIIAAREQKNEAYTKYFPQIQANVAAFQLFERLGESDNTYTGSTSDGTTITDEQIASTKEFFKTFLPVTDGTSNIGYIDPMMSFLTGTELGYTGSYNVTTHTSGFNRAYAGALTVVQPVFMGGRIVNGNKLASVGIDAAQLKQVIKEKDILQKVTECFWKLATVKYNINTVEAAEKQIAAVKIRVQDLVDNGVTTANALLQVKLREQELASTRLKLENGDQLLRLLLAQLIGITNDEIDIIAPDSKVQPKLPVYAGENSSETRAELELASKGVEAEKLRLKIEKGKLLPSLGIGLAAIALGHNYNNVSGNLTTSLTRNVNVPLLQYENSQTTEESRPFDMSDQITKNKVTGFAMATLSIPISDWWGGTHAVRRQKVRLNQAEETYQDAKEKLALDNKSAWLKVTEAYKQISIARASVENAEENLRMHTDQYENGTITITDLLDAETLNRKAENQLSSALADYQVSLADYQRKVQR